MRWSVIGSAILVALTEVLSLAHLIVRPVFIGIWVIAVAVVLPRVLRTDWHKKTDQLKSLTTFERAQVAAIVFILAVTLFIALIAPPNSFDALGYHSARLSQWVQNKSVGSFPTHIDRQLWEPPLSEYYGLYFRLLTGNDWLANIPQWLAFIGCILLSMRVAFQLGANRTTQLFAGLLTATLPMAIAQASGSLVDLIAAYWQVCAVSLALDAMRSLRLRQRDSLLTGASFGLAALAKGTAYFFLAPFVLWLAFTELRRNRARALLPIVVALFAALAINAGIYSRNYSLYGNPVGVSTGPRLTNEIITPAVATSNVIRNLAINFNSRSDRLNQLGVKVVGRIHRWLGLTLGDPRTTYFGLAFTMNRWPRDEIFVGNPFHLILFAVFGTAVIVSARARRRDRMGIVVCVVAGLVVFSTFLKWQLINSRLELPLFVLASAIIATAVQDLTRQRVMQLMAAFFFVACLTVLLADSKRPIISRTPIWTMQREERYFASAPQLYKAHAAAANLLASRHCSNIGLITTWVDFEELIWVLMRSRMPSVKIRHVAVSPREYPDPYYRDTIPSDICAIVTDIQYEILRLPTQRVPEGWTRAFDEYPLQVYFRQRAP